MSPDGDEADLSLERLSLDPAGAASRLAICETISGALGRLGQLLWVGGFLIGGDRVSGRSPMGFGDDAAVGLATVAQIGGQLSTGAITLLKAGNLYAASALVRQLVEVEYLAHAFAHDHTVAAEWLRADRSARRAYWTPGAVRSRADGAFPAGDYWRHCDLGGHPTTDGRRLLPDHMTINVSYLWVDLAGHLARIWHSTQTAAEQLYGSVISDWQLPDVDRVMRAWRDTDGLAEALEALSRQLHGDE